ncbi:MAG: prepilin-type N-terminal cleavage/methylation domain-containing protein [Candidatus Omnitrophica bacterium]|nr:prepilin-type N-terminal cleavage/methylation domain-containing protein [Candidatus Omnitrophota bacterium]
MKNKDGLTLLEILIAISLLSILGVTINIAFKSGFDAWLTAQRRVEIYQDIRMSLDMLTRELPGAFVGGVGGFRGIEEGSVTYDGGGFGPNYIGEDPDSIEFTTLVEGNIYQVRYYLDGTTMRRCHETNPDDFADPVWDEINDIGTHINDFDIRYWNGSAWTSDGDWTTTGTLPDAVEITITGIDSEGNIFPFRTTLFLANSG